MCPMPHRRQTGILRPGNKAARAFDGRAILSIPLSNCCYPTYHRSENFSARRDRSRDPARTISCPRTRIRRLAKNNNIHYGTYNAIRSNLVISRHLTWKCGFVLRIRHDLNGGICMKTYGSPSVTTVGTGKKNSREDSTLTQFRP